MADVWRSDKTRSGCGILYAVFGRKLWTKTSSSMGSSKRRRDSLQEEEEVDVVPSRTPLGTTNGNGGSPRRTPPKTNDNGGTTSRMPPQKQMPIRPLQQQEKQGHQGQHGQKGKKQQTTTPLALGISGELENIIAEHQRGKGSATNAGLMRASSGNVMLYGHLGNLRQPPTTAAEQQAQFPRKYANNNNSNKNNGPRWQEINSSPLCRAISCRMDPEQLKILGNEDYKNGRFAEALALYDRAIDMDPSKASYRSNKSAALTALGRLLEAALECKEAIQIDPNYHRAHHRLGNLYLRLGHADKAMYHFNKAGPGEADPDAIAKAKLLLSYLNHCHHAKRIQDWNALITATNNAISAGADSAPNVFGLQAEAFLRLHRHEDAESALSKGPTFDIEQSITLLGGAANVALLLIRAQVHMACGRVEEAVGAAERAGQVDPSNREVGPIRRRARSVASARAHGNQLFRESKFGDAATAYSEGLEHDPYNSVLLCNRAACRSKLGHYHKALEDCNAALKLRPSYHKARLRRADCYSKLGKWEMAVQDYEILMRDSPEDEELRRDLLEAQMQLNNFNQEVEVEELSSLAKAEGVMSFPAFVVYKNGSKEKQVETDAYELLETSVKESAAS